MRPLDLPTIHNLTYKLLPTNFSTNAFERMIANTGQMRTTMIEMKLVELNKRRDAREDDRGRRIRDGGRAVEGLLHFSRSSLV